MGACRSAKLDSRGDCVVVKFRDKDDADWTGLEDGDSKGATARFDLQVDARARCRARTAMEAFADPGAQGERGAGRGPVCASPLAAFTARDHFSPEVCQKAKLFTLRESPPAYPKTAT